MGKIISICGSPSSGKTTAGLKIAQELYYQRKVSVIYISPDWNKPTVSFLFPFKKEAELHSLGNVLDKTAVTADDILAGCVYSEKNENFGYLGYKAGENRFSFPIPTEDKVLGLLRAASDLAEYVFVDCSSYYDDPISRIAMRKADWHIQFIVSDLLSMVYYLSYEEKYKQIESTVYKVINSTSSDVYLPEGLVKAHFENIMFNLPYSMALKKQSVSGVLSDKINDMKFRKECAKLVEMLP